MRTAAQNKAESGEYVDSVGELVAKCEEEGFIPRYYIDQPNDSVDRTLMDLQHYTKTLVTDELNLGNMIESSLKQIVEDRENESSVTTDQDGVEDVDENFFDYEEKEITDADYSEYFEKLEEDRRADEEYLASLAKGRNDL